MTLASLRYMLRLLRRHPSRAIEAEVARIRDELPALRSRVIQDSAAPRVEAWLRDPR